MSLKFTRHPEKSFIADIVFNALNNLYKIVIGKNPGIQHENWSSMTLWTRLNLLIIAMRGN
jgi:hypothetical protein